MKIHGVAAESRVLQQWVFIASVMMQLLNALQMSTSTHQAMFLGPLSLCHFVCG
jgi:hypothetical protein